MEGSLLLPLGGTVFWLGTHSNQVTRSSGECERDDGVVAAERCPTRLLIVISNAGCPTQLRAFDR
jgi:hypothetical protein